MSTEALIELFTRDFKRLTKEVESYGNEAELWIVQLEIKNSAGNLAMHLAGNLQHFIGSVLGETGYVRNREYEFNCKDISRKEVIETLKKAEEDVHSTLSKLSTADLEKKYPIDVFGKGSFKTGYFLLHLYGHFNYHLGQINYHRRLITST